MFVKNIYTRVASGILTTAIGFAPFIFIIKVFGKKVVGNIAYYYSIAGRVSIFVDLGLSKV